MKFIVGLSICILAVQLKAATPHYTRMVQSKPIVSNGLEFIAATEAEWVCFNSSSGQDPIEVQLYIRNCTSQPMLFSTFDTFDIIIKDSSGHEINESGGRDGTLRTKTVLLDANSSHCLCRKAVLQWNGNKSRTFTYWDGTGSWSVYGTLFAGEYSLSFWCRRSQKETSGRNDAWATWYGDVQTNLVSFKIVDP